MGVDCEEKAMKGGEERAPALLQGGVEASDKPVELGEQQFLFNLPVGVAMAGREERRKPGEDEGRKTRDEGRGSLVLLALRLRHSLRAPQR
jgi:hypothetical protein